MLDIIALVVIGLFAGTAGGMLGIGGSIVMIPAMTEVLGPDQHLYQAAALIVNFFVVVPAVIQHRRAKAVEPASVMRLIPLAVVGSIAGVLLSELPIFAGTGESLLRLVFGLFLATICVIDLVRLVRPPRVDPDAAERPAVSWASASTIALPTGTISGLLGVGGGIVAVPLQRKLLSIPIRNAIANSAALIIATSFVGATLKNYAYFANTHSYRSFYLAAILIPTAIVGSLIGSRLTHLVPVKTVKTAFLILMVVAAIRLIYKSLPDIPLG